MNVVDSNGWLEYFADGPNAKFFSNAIENIKDLLVPTISIYEVFKRIMQQRSENEALQAMAVMQQAKVVDIDTTIAIYAAKLSIEKKLPMADSLMLSTANIYNATFWTQDAHFSEIEDIKYVSAKSK